MNIVSLTDVDKSVGSGLLFEEVSLGIEEGEKIGLVGRNGSGKSTFLRLLTGELEPDEGAITRSRGLRLSPLAQRPPVIAGLTVDDYLFAETELPSEEIDAAEQAATLQRYRVICTQLGMDDPSARLETLSGGMLKKIAIARCLAFDADLRTLDEPTNHLDLDSVIWLEQRLKTSTDGFVMVTHDREMLDAVCTTIFEVADRTIYRHPGNYSTYLRRKADRQDERDSAEQRRVTILRRELEWLQRGPKARTGKDKGRKDRIDAMLEAGPESEASMQSLPAAERRLGKKVLEIDAISKSYDGSPVVSDFTYEFTPGERLGVIGPNGCGKTTLLDMIAGRVEPDTGAVSRGETTAFAYFDQTGRRIDASKTVLDYLKDEAERVRVSQETTISAEQFLERFLFPRSMFAQPLERLSGGEFRRLYLVRLLATAPNFLLLDEPTNDLDIETLRVLEQYLEDFSGCVLLVSHDRALLNRLTDSLLVFDGTGGVRSFVGNYDAYRESLAQSQAANRDQGAGRSGSGRKAVDREKKPGLSFREAQEYERLPDEVASGEEELKSIEAKFGESTHDPAELEAMTKRYHALREEVERKTARWEELAERAEE